MAQVALLSTHYTSTHNTTTHNTSTHNTSTHNTTTPNLMVLYVFSVLDIKCGSSLYVLLMMGILMPKTR
jgi:hypothetical protein